MFSSILGRIHLFAILYSLSLQVAAQTNQPYSGTSSWTTSTSTTKSQLLPSASEPSDYFSALLNPATSVSTSIASPTGFAVISLTGATDTTFSSTSSLTNAASPQQSCSLNSSAPGLISCATTNISSPSTSVFNLTTSVLNSTTSFLNSTTSTLPVLASTTSTISGLSSPPSNNNGTTLVPIIKTSGTIPSQTSGVPTSSSAVGVLPVITRPSSSLTTSPSGFSTEAASNTLWTGNTWITTTAGGSTTVVPVIVGCHNCGGIHGGIVLWNFPHIPDVSFTIPGFPKLPKFSFPCIDVFGVKINCPPPATDSDAGTSGPSDPSNPDPSKPDPSKPDPSNPDPSIPDPSSPDPSNPDPSNPDPPKPVPPKPDPPKSEPTTQTGSASRTSSSSSSCSITKTVSDCSVVCATTTTSLTSAGPPATTQKCSTTCYSTLTGCSITGTTTTTTQSSSTREPCAYTCTACRGAAIRNVAAAATSTPDSSSAALKARTLPRPSQYPNGLLGLLAAAYTDPQTQWVPLSGGPTGGRASARFIKFGTEPFNLGVKGLIGCTSVAVISKRGIWLSHFWERDQFESGDQVFKREVLEAMAWGDLDNPGNPDMQSLSGAYSEGFAPEAQTDYKNTNYIFVVTPVDSGDIMGTLAFQDQVNDIIRVANDLLSGGLGSFDRSAYSSIVPYGTSNSIVEDGKDDESPFGKIILQYSPAYSCGGESGQYAETRLFFQDTKIYHNFWQTSSEDLTNTGPVPSYWTPDPPRGPPLTPGLQAPGRPLTYPGRPAGPGTGPRDVENSSGSCPIPKASGQNDTVILASTGLIPVTSLPAPSTSFLASATALPPTTPTTGAVLCSPTAGPDSVPVGVPSAAIKSNITEYCSFLIDNTEGQIGCIESKGVCNGTSFTAYPLPYDYSGVTVWLNVSLNSGSFSSFSESSCESALTSVLNACAISAKSDMVSGGGIPVSDGSGGTINFNISLKADTSQYLSSTSAVSSSTTPSLVPLPSTTSTEATSSLSSTSAPPVPSQPAPPPQSTSTTIPAPSPSPLFTPGKCNIHIWEATQTYNTPVGVQLNITDGAGKLLSSLTWDHITFGPNGITTAPMSDTHLPYNVSVTFTQLTKATKLKSRLNGGSAPATVVPWESWIFELSAGKAVWNSQINGGLPSCMVGNWDNGNFVNWLRAFTGFGDAKLPNRQSDCQWAC